MDNFDESKIEFEFHTPIESVLALSQTVPAVMASASEEACLFSQLLQVQQVRTNDAQSDPLLRIDYEFWTKPDKFEPAKPERVTYRREHLYVRVSVLVNGELFLNGLGPEFSFEAWFQDDLIEGNPETTGLPKEGYVMLLQETTGNHLGAIAEHLVDDEQEVPDDIREDMQRLYYDTEMARRKADKTWEELEIKRDKERQQSKPTWDPHSLHFLQDAEKLILFLHSPERQFIWTASVILLPDGPSSSIKLSKGRKVPSPLNYVAVSKTTIKAPCSINPKTAEAELRDLFTSGWLPQQLERLE